MKAIQIEAFGKAAGGLRVVDVPDVGAPAGDEVVIALEAAPITGSDLSTVAGVYGTLPELPAVGGFEGVGRVVAAGPDVKHLKVGDLTLMPALQPSWVERVKTREGWLRPLPEGDVGQLAMLAINPATAYLLLKEYKPLAAGDWVIQNGANSPVGRALIAIAKRRGIRTVNVVRRPEVVAEVEALGGDVVLVDGPDLAQRVAEATGQAPIGLAIDMVGGESTQHLMDTLADGGTLVFYAVVSRQPLQGSVFRVVFNDLSIRGFWLLTWFKTATDEQLVTMYAELAEMVAKGEIEAPIAGTYRFDQIEEAFAQAGRRSGKVILQP
jgi:mitochondrial enoyl-[acyl-carrier protein] reductase / trans-2-enoyl-CoA reductase